MERDSDADELKVTGKEADKLRKFLKDGSEFKGLEETAVTILKK